MKRVIEMLGMLAAVGASAGCGLGDKASQAQANLEALEAEYEAFDLTCDFEDVSGSKGDDALALQSSAACEDAQQQFAILVDEFDADGDQKLSDGELAEAEQGFEDARKANVDANGDGTVSAEEKAAWKKEKGDARKEKRNERFAKACETLKKNDAECKEMHGKRKGEVKARIEGRKAEFDKNGDGKLDEAERKAMEEKLRAERGQKKDEFKKQHDKDGDGKISGEERQERRDQRKPPPGGPKGQGPKGEGPKQP